MLVVFEGIDRSGKSSIMESVADVLRSNGVPLSLVKFPLRNTPVGKLIDRYLRGEKFPLRVAHLLFVANRWELADELSEEMKSKLVLCDRYSYSGVAYSVALGLDYEWCWNMENGLPEPDLIIFVDADPDVVRKRKGFGDEVYEKVEIQRKVVDEYKKMFRDRKNVFFVESNKSFDDAVRDVVKVIERIIQTDLAVAARDDNCVIA